MNYKLWQTGQQVNFALIVQTVLFIRIQNSKYVQDLGKQTIQACFSHYLCSIFDVYKQMI